MQLTSSWHLLKGYDCYNQNVFGDIKVRKLWSPTFSCRFLSLELLVWMCARHRTSIYTIQCPKRKKLEELFRLVEITILRSSVFDGYWYCYLTQCNRRGFQCLQYNNYLISLSKNMNNAVAFEYGASFSAVMKPALGLGKMCNRI